jgi:hypothetical protein
MKLTACHMLLVPLFLLACQNGPSEFTDSEGRVFLAHCAEGACRYESKGAEGEPPRAVTLAHAGRVAAVCDSVDTPEPLHCRAITCTEACPARPNGAPLTCDGGLCVDTSRELSAADVRLLCLAGTGTGRNAAQAERLALAAGACDGQCRVPAACRQL